MSDQINEAIVLETLKDVIDPELGCNVVDLGLIYNISIAGSKISIAMTLTSPGCPMSESMAGGVQQALLGLKGVEDVSVDLTWDPPWNPSMMTEVGRAMTGAFNY